MCSLCCRLAVMIASGLTEISLLQFSLIDPCLKFTSLSKNQLHETGLSSYVPNALWMDYGDACLLNRRRTFFVEAFSRCVNSIHRAGQRCVASVTEHSNEDKTFWLVSLLSVTSITKLLFCDRIHIYFVCNGKNSFVALNPGSCLWMINLDFLASLSINGYGPWPVDAFTVLYIVWSCTSQCEANVRSHWRQYCFHNVSIHLLVSIRSFTRSSGCQT